MSYISLGEASKGFNVSKATLSKAIKSGKMSFVERSETGAYKLDPAEVARFVGNMQKPAPITGHQPLAETPETPSLAVENAKLAAQVEGLREMVEELRSSRDHWQTMAETQTRLLEHAASAPQKARGGFWGWLGTKKAANG